MIGGRDHTGKTIFRVPNISNVPQSRYLMGPDAFLQAYYAIEREGNELVAIYHSHPNSAPAPSVVDIAEATWPDIYTVIVGCVSDEPRMEVWAIRTGKVIPVSLVVF